MPPGSDDRTRPRQAVLFPLRPGAIDLWVARTGEMSDSELAHQLDTVLSEDERRQRARFMFEKDRRRYLVTRALVRNVLSRYLPVPPADWRFATTDFGRPYVTGEPPGAAGLAFNISHSDRVVVLALARGCELGVDVEDLGRHVPLEIADRFFAPDEVRQLQALPPEDRPRRFLDFWTLKESYIKARGMGLSLPLDKFGFELAGEGPPQVFFEAGIDYRPGRWIFLRWRPTPDSVAALCAENVPGIEQTVSVRLVSSFDRAEDATFDAVGSCSQGFVTISRAGQFGNDEDARQEGHVRRAVAGDQAAALPDGGDAGVRALVRGLPVEPAQPRGDDGRAWRHG